MFLADGTPVEPENMPRARALRGEYVETMDLSRINSETGEQLDEAGTPDHHPLFASVQRISASADRMSDLISDLLAFTQTQSAELTPQSVSDWRSAPAGSNAMAAGYRLAAETAAAARR